MKILAINSVPYGSTCNIMLGISEMAIQRHTYIVATGFSNHPVNFKIKHNKIGGPVDKAIHMWFSIATGYIGCYSRLVTKLFLKEIDKYHPDILHLHNLHGWYINLPMLFNYIKKNNIRVIWTLHDCWSFTGRCPHFQICKCDRWKIGCGYCPYPKHDYPASYVDRTKRMWTLKKKWFTGVQNMTIVTPSQWLADLVKESFLKEYPVKVINNGIDLTIFKPTESDFRDKHHISQDKKVLLGVAFGWGVRKGLDVFIELSKRLPDNYQIVLVGTDDEVDKQMPDNIISIHRTQDQKELAEIYTAADLFVNPTREENYPTVNMESIACGTPVLTFRTGGSPEILDDTCGSVVDCDDVDAMEKEIIRICEQTPYSHGACLKKAKEFDMNDRFKEYIDLYEEVQ